MDLETIRWQINECEMRLLSCEEEKQLIVKNKEECSALLDKISRLQHRFCTKQKQRIDIIQKNIACLDNIKMARTYYIGMNSLLCGSEYIRVNSGLDNAQTKVRDKIKALQNQLDEKKEEILQIQRRLDDLYRELTLKQSSNAGLQ